MGKPKNMITARKRKILARRIAYNARKWGRLAVYTFILLTIFLGLASLFDNYTISFRSPIVIEEKKFEFLSPIPEDEIVKPSPTATPSAKPESATRGVHIVKEVRAKEIEVRTVEGEASYYSRAGCLGCSETLTMANGEELDDAALTLALTPEMVSEHKLLNDLVTVKNKANGKTVKARVTDTGGFGKYNRVADLSVATKDAIACSSLCEVQIIY